MPLLFSYMLITSMNSAAVYDDYIRYDDSHLIKPHLTAVYPEYRLEAEGHNLFHQEMDDWFRDVGMFLQKLAATQTEITAKAFNKALDIMAKENKKSE